MQTRFKIQFLQYFPDVTSEQHIDIALVLRSSDPEQDRYRVRIMEEWSAVRALDPDADLVMLQEMASTFANELRGAGAEAFLKICSSGDNTVRLSAKQPYESDLSADKAADAVWSEYLRPFAHTNRT